MKDNDEDKNKPKEPASDKPSRSSANYKSLPFNPKLKKKARELRKAGNLPEVILWYYLKGKKFKGLDFDRQKVIGNYIVDFYCSNCNAVIEIDGTSHNYKGAYDAERDDYLKSLELEVIHITAKDILRNRTGVFMMLNDHPVFN
jgi:very-short-patch-repair endonuclease